MTHFSARALASSSTSNFATHSLLSIFRPLASALSVGNANSISSRPYKSQFTGFIIYCQNKRVQRQNDIRKVLTLSAASLTEKHGDSKASSRTSISGCSASAHPPCPPALAHRAVRQSAASTYNKHTVTTQLSSNTACV